MNDIMWMIISTFICYMSLILHEIGHCVFPRLVGFNLFNVVIIGEGDRLFSFKILGLHFRFYKLLFPPFGGFFTTRRFANKEEYREYMREQTKPQIFFTHFGGNLMNVCIALASWIIMRYMGVNMQSNGFVWLISRLVFYINVAMFVFNLLPFSVHNDIEEFSGSDVVQLFRRLKANKGKADISI